MPTKGGIYWDLENSQYFVDLITNKKDVLRIFFSSRLYRNKFLLEVNCFIDESRRKNNFIKMDNNYVIYYSLIYYSKIEKRGFYCEKYNNEHVIKSYKKIEDFKIIIDIE